MPKLKRLLLPVCFEVAQRKRRCFRNRGHNIRKGDKCLVIKQNMRSLNYCMACATLMLDKTIQELNELALEVGAPGR